MATTIKKVVEAFRVLFSAINDKEFGKTLQMHEWNEQELAPLVRTFLLGHFGEIIPEAKAKLPGTPSGYGRIDFVVKGVAVELAVRRRSQSKAPLSASVNSNEVKKLLKFNGPAVLVLFDFSATPLTSQQLDGFRDWPSLGKGPHSKSPFNVAYFFRTADNVIDCIRKNIHVA